jgi:hypothetical protein
MESGTFHGSALQTNPINQTPLQPPLPLQLFWPLQLLLSLPPLQPPWPLQEFLPLQSCLPVSLLGALAPGALVLSCARVFTAKPVINPVTAAATSNVLCVLLIIFLVLVFGFCFGRRPRILYPRRAGSQIRDGDP